MRILQVNSHVGRVGGAEVYLHALVDELRRREHVVGLFGGTGESSERTDELCAVERPDFSFGALFRDEPLTAAFQDFAADFRPDLIHVHNLFGLPADFPAVIAGAGVPVVQTVHDLSLLCPNSWGVWGDGTPCGLGAGKQCFEHDCTANYPFDGRIVAAARMRGDLARRCFGMFRAPSTYFVKRLAEHDFPHLARLPYWVDEELAAKLDEQPAAERAADHVLFLGRLVKEKGVDVLLRAWPLVLRSFPSAKLTIVGGGAEEAPLRELAAGLGLDADAIFVGKVPHAEVLRHYRTATCQVLPSIWCENSPVTTYESYLAELPMVASDIAGLPDMVRPGETGLLAKPRDPVDLAEKICELLGDPELRTRLGEGCRASVERFSRELHMQALLPAYEELLTLPLPEQDAGLAELAAGLDQWMAKYVEVEDWALGMKGHIASLEKLIPGAPAMKSAALGLRGVLGRLRGKR